jgi:glycosyltransferase involved in cell wall biosynthesis
MSTRFGPESSRAHRQRNWTAPTISVVIPARNEAANLPAVISRLPDDLFEVILVDGHSTDGTVDVARELLPEVRVFHQDGRGKGDALAMGFAAVTGDIIVMLDADGSADAAEIPRFVAALVAGADFVKGSRFAQGGGSSDITPTRRLGNRALCALVNRAYGMVYTDLCYGYNAFWADCLPSLQCAWPGSPFPAGTTAPYGTGFEVETMLNIRAAKAGLIVWEMPSFERPRISGQSNLHAVRDGLRILRTIWRESPGQALRRERAVIADLQSTVGASMALPSRRRHEDRVPSLPSLPATEFLTVVPEHVVLNGNGHLVPPANGHMP